MKSRNIDFRSIGTISILGLSNRFQHIRYVVVVYFFYFFGFLFINSTISPNTSSLITLGFDCWKRVNQGNKGAFIVLIGTTSSSYHNDRKRRVEDLMKPTQHIDKVVSSEER